MEWNPLCVILSYIILGCDDYRLLVFGDNWQSTLLPLYHYTTIIIPVKPLDPVHWDADTSHLSPRPGTWSWAAHLNYCQQYSNWMKLDKDYVNQGILKHDEWSMV